MRYQLTPNKPRPLSTVHAGVAPGRDLRWRGVPFKVGRLQDGERITANTTVIHELVVAERL